jgi:class 3 adenylate cyclase
MNLIRKWESSDETVDFGGVVEQLISIGGLTVSRSVQPVGWHWREHFQPLLGEEWCQAHHVGITLEGRQAIRLEDGTEIHYGPGDLYDIPPGHDGWTLGDDPCVMLEWSGQRRWVGGSTSHRVMASLLFKDIVDSTGTAARLGDAPWHDLLSLHYHQADAAIERFGGRRITTTGDGILASFDAAAAAVRCGLAIRDAARGQEVDLRLGVHVGEVELAGDDVLGVTVHEAARVMAAAGRDELLVSEPVRMLSQVPDLSFEDTGEHELKGIPGLWRLDRVMI